MTFSPEHFGVLALLAIAVTFAIAWELGFRNGRRGRSAVDYNRGYQRGRIERGQAEVQRRDYALVDCGLCGTTGKLTPNGMEKGGGR